MEQKYYLLFDHTWAANRGPTERPIRIAFPTRGWIALFIWHHQRTAVPVAWAIVGKLNSSPESKAKFCWIQLLTCHKSMCTYSQNSAWRKHLLRYVFPFVPQTRSVFFVHLCVQLTPFVRTVQRLKSTLVTSRRTKTQSWHVILRQINVNRQLKYKKLTFLAGEFSQFTVVCVYNPVWATHWVCIFTAHLRTIQRPPSLTKWYWTKYWSWKI